MLLLTDITNKLLQNTISIQINNAGKKFGTEWIFKGVDLEIKPSEKIVILGLNGSGKSTFLQAISGYLILTKGDISFFNNDIQVDSEEIYQLVSISSPYLELIEDYTLEELVKHLSYYKSYLNNLSPNEVIELSGLEKHKEKYIRLFSSGMKQRLKLSLAIFSNTPILLLDEPTTNLDATVINWYKEMIEKYAKHKTVIVCSNSVKDEYEFCTRTILMDNYK